MARRALTQSQLTLVQAVSTALDEAGTVPSAVGPVPVRGLLIAVSGGADSLGLAAASAVVAARRGMTCRAVTIDHGLQRGSALIAAAAVAQVEAWGLPGVTIPVSVGTDGGMEAAARKARYEALEHVAEPGEWILLGHTREDQAETVLLGLARGSGTRSLAGMAPRRGLFLRPLLDVRRDVVAQAATDWGADPHVDIHNADRRFARVRVRLDVLPVLEDALGPGVTEALARTARLARADADLLDELAAVPDASDCRSLAALPSPLRNRALKHWLETVGATDLQETHIAAVAALVTHWKGQAAVDVPGVRVWRRSDALHAERRG